jgi:hypothetical protein
MVIAAFKVLDDLGNKKTEFAKYAEIVIKIYEIAEIIMSPNSVKAV